MPSADAPPGRFPRRRTVLLLVLVVLAAAGAWKARAHVAAWDHLTAGRAALDRDDPTEARRRLDACLRVWPTDREANLVAAKAARRCGDLAAALKFLAQVERVGGRSADIELERALGQVQAGRLAGVEAPLLRTLADGDAESSEIVAVLVPHYLADFRIAEAGTLSAKWVELRPESAKAWAYRADALERLRKTDEALAAFRRVVELSPTDRAARLNLARLAVENHRPLDEASRHLEGLVAADPDDAPALVQLAACREAQGRPDDAAALLDRVIAGSAGDAKALHLRGRLELNRGNVPAATAFVRRAAALGPADVETLYTLYLCVQQTGTPAEVRAAEERYRRCDADLKRVAELARTIAASPDDPDPRREIGELFLRNGRVADGLRWLDSALRIDPGHAATHRVLAAHHDSTGRPDLARHHNAQAMPRFPAEIPK